MRCVKLKSLKAGPDGVFQPGQKILVSDEDGQELVGGGYAEWADPPLKVGRVGDPSLPATEGEADTQEPAPTTPRRTTIRAQQRKS